MMKLKYANSPLGVPRATPRVPRRFRLLAALTGLALALGVLSACSNDGTTPSGPQDPSVSGSGAPSVGAETPSDNAADSSTPVDASDGSYKVSTREITVPIGDQSIYGVAYLPDTDTPVPLVIISHGLGITHESVGEYARFLASHGIAAYTPDFRGGSTMSRSDGETTEMSVMTEADDIEAIMAAATGWEFFDQENLYLMGESQGGAASGVVAARRPDDVDKLVLLYPAFVIPDVVRESYPSRSDLPETFSMFGWMTLGRVYGEDVWDWDFEADARSYPNPVLIIQGTADVVVPPAYAERADAAYPDSQLHMLEGAGHGFYGSEEDTAKQYALDFLR
ncbi:alpha/beta fold hydrolase [Actinobaculum sp. 352]|uniref:alpha/beta hydrolase n=1 Tax=Actinobaculum sp. 352 TaxID=2490946 RepID=UPI000F7EF8FA|nr:alpha/beta fold hydrolase [Actinobaculum sp. 352]RTE49316.1 alpha/beta fold hydrolase [Actinobaculum sp. 352]